MDIHGWHGLSQAEPHSRLFVSIRGFSSIRVHSWFMIHSRALAVG
jgi:hypothetical protein